MNRWLSIAYAGRSVAALDAIRAVKATASLTTQGVIEHLSSESKRSAGEFDFLVCSHEQPSQPRLIRIYDGRASEGADIYWLGDHEAAKELSRSELSPIQGEKAGEFFSLEERRFSRRFKQYIDGAANPAVGGMVVECLGSAFGHCYQDHYCSRIDRVTIPDPMQRSLREQLNKAGMDGAFKYAVMSPPDRGVGIVGVHFEQANVGFIHAPLERDDPEKVVMNRDDFQRLLAERSRAAAYASLRVG